MGEIIFGIGMSCSALYVNANWTVRGQNGIEFSFLPFGKGQGRYLRFCTKMLKIFCALCPLIIALVIFIIYSEIIFKNYYIHEKEKL